MTPARMAEIHAAAFEGRGQVWTEADFAAFCARPHVQVIVAGTHGFAVLQCIPPEAEILTIAVEPGTQGRGVGTALLQDTMARAARCGAETLFLDVAEDNAPARALYRKAGFAEVGQRRGYYARGGAAAVDALVLSRRLDAEKTGKPFKS